MLIVRSVDSVDSEKKIAGTVLIVRSVDSVDSEKKTISVDSVDSVDSEKKNSSFAAMLRSKYVYITGNL